MPTFKGNHYVPVLTWKRAEQAALASTSAAARAGLTPMIELIEIPTDLESGEKTKTLEQHVELGLEKLEEVWGTSEFFLDPEMLANETTASGTGAAAHVYAAAQARGLHFIPVTGPSRSGAETAAALANRQRGVCVRLTPADFSQLLWPLFLTQFVQTHHLSHSDVDLVLDLESTAGMQQFALNTTVSGLLQQVPAPTHWRTLTLASSVFPPHLGGIQAQALIERMEWAVWSALHASRASLPRLPTFADYVIQSPEQLEGYDPRYMAMSPAIRNTLSTQWLIIRGQSSKRQRLKQQFPQLAAQLVASHHFMGAGHCAGCRDVVSCSNGAGGLGSAEVWRRIGTTHHLEFVSAQVAAVAFP